MRFLQFDVHAVSSLAMELGVGNVPAFFFFEEGEKRGSVVTYNPDFLRGKLEGFRHAGRVVSLPEKGELKL